jgi:hypothetical protein
MTERGLVIARVGKRSLHPLWLDNDTVREWTLYISPYEELPPQLCQGCEVGEVIPGPKWSGLRTLLERWSGWRDYDYVWMPDDDILTDQATISRMFREARRLGFDLFAPALHEDSHFAHYFTMRNRNLSARAVGFVEIMVPGFSRAALEQLRHTWTCRPRAGGGAWTRSGRSSWDYRTSASWTGSPSSTRGRSASSATPSSAAAVNEESDTLLRRYGAGRR